MAKFIASLLVAIAVTVAAGIKKSDAEDVSAKAREKSAGFYREMAAANERMAQRNEAIIRIANNEGERLIALENLRESRAELRRYQALSR